jgi:hypothetical protein
MVIPVADLVRMDAAGLITEDVEKALAPELAERLKHGRETE